jgi:hypothetical protein
LGDIINPGTKRRSVSPHASSGHVHKLGLNTSPPRTLSPTDKGAEDGTFYRTPDTKRTACHSSLVKRDDIVYAQDVETQIVAEARGVTRKNIPWGTFRSIYLSDFGTETGTEASAKAQQKFTVSSVKKIGKGNWEEQLFWRRLREALSSEVR